MDRLIHRIRCVLSYAVILPVWISVLAGSMYLLHAVLGNGALTGVLVGLCGTLGLYVGILAGGLILPPYMEFEEDNEGDEDDYAPLPEIRSSVGDEIGKSGELTRIAQEQAAQSYTNITREARTFFLATEKLEKEAVGMTDKDCRDLHTARLEYLQSLTDSFREGQEIIRRYLKGA